jgi:hypothetical protein
MRGCGLFPYEGSFYPIIRKPGWATTVADGEMAREGKNLWSGVLRREKVSLFTRENTSEMYQSIFVHHLSIAASHIRIRW